MSNKYLNKLLFPNTAEEWEVNKKFIKELSGEILMQMESSQLELGNAFNIFEQMENLVGRSIQGITNREYQNFIQQENPAKSKISSKQKYLIEELVRIAGGGWLPKDGKEFTLLGGKTMQADEDGLKHLCELAEKTLSRHDFLRHRLEVMINTKIDFINDAPFEARAESIIKIKHSLGYPSATPLSFEKSEISSNDPPLRYLVEQTVVRNKEGTDAVITATERKLQYLENGVYKGVPTVVVRDFKPS